LFAGEEDIKAVLNMTTNILILCTHNSARSVLSEAMLNYWANQLKTISTLQTVGIDTSNFRSKSWDEFALTSAPPMRIVITVCDSAASEVCPIWPGAPVKIHWGYPDPSNISGGDDAKRTAFELTRQAIAYKMLRLVQLPFDRLSNAELQTCLNAIERI
jgi:arsenate reductase (thioredoxin)